MSKRKCQTIKEGKDMKNEILYVLLDNYADHEPAFLASATMR